MTADPAGAPRAWRPAWTFGAFRFIHARTPQLLHGGQEVPLDAPALRVLATLLAHAGEVVVQDELLRSAWPGRQMSASSGRDAVRRVRAALARFDATTMFIQSVSGRGYSFVASVSPGAAALDPGDAAPVARAGESGASTRLVGREEAIASIRTILDEHRLVTVLGPGGIGKTAVANALLQAAQAGRAGPNYRWVDLGVVRQPADALPSIAAQIGAVAAQEDPAASIVRHLADAQDVIVLDSCEHVLAVVAPLVQALVCGTRVRILVTTREALDVDSEWVFRLAAMETPANSSALGAQEARTFSAIRLFEVLARRQVRHFEVTDENAAAVGELCRLLDGLPLAIELAAARVELFGVRGLLEQMSHRFRVLSGSLRTALPRHRTLRAAMDWSWDLLPEDERLVLRRISVFRGWFAARLAGDCVSDGTLHARDVMPRLRRLVQKSLLVAAPPGRPARFRLLDTTRAYAAERLAEAGETRSLMRRHAEFVHARLRHGLADPGSGAARRTRQTCPLVIEEVWAATDWALCEDGDPELGIELVLASLPLGYAVGDLRMHGARLERALAVLPHVSQALQGRAHLRLNMALGAIAGQIDGVGPARNAAFSRALAQAGPPGNAAEFAQLTNGQWIDAFGRGNYPAALALADALAAHGLARNDDPVHRSALRMRAQCLHFLGRFEESDDIALTLLKRPREAAYRVAGTPQPVAVAVSMRVVLARSHWIRGHADTAMRLANEAVTHARSDMAHSLCQALALAAAPIAVWQGDLPGAARLQAQLHDEAVRHGLPYWEHWARAYGDAWRAAAQGIETPGVASMVDTKLDDMRATLPGMAATPATLTRVLRGEVGWCAAEVLRAHALAALCDVPSGVARSLGLLRDAIRDAESRGAWSWRLRASIDLATVLRTHDQCIEAHRILAKSLAGPPAGIDSFDRRRAEALLAELATSQHCPGDSTC